jgi:hypothetical protein
MAEKVKQKRVRSFRLSERLEQMIKDECQRRQIGFSRFMRFSAERSVNGAQLRLERRTCGKFVDRYTGR